MEMSSIYHNIKHRTTPYDEFKTPVELARKLVALVPLKPGDVVLDSAVGNGAFYENYPLFVNKDCCDTLIGVDFLAYSKKVDWIITNPPYSNLDAWFSKATEVSRKGFAYLLGFTNITPRRIEMANKVGFGLTQIHLCKVFHWFGISAFTIFEKGKGNIISYDRVVWRVSDSY